MKVPFKGCTFEEFPKGSVTQWFGETPKLYAPLGLKGHNGIDLVAPHGTPLLAVEDGIVLGTKEDPSGFGRNVRFLGSDKNGVYNAWTYGHCDKVLVKPGDVISAGDVIATMGNTGFTVSSHRSDQFWGVSPTNTDGTHLHLGLRKVKRDKKGWSYPGSDIKITVLNTDNGYKGSIDPRSLFTKDTPEISSLKAQVSLLQKVLELYKKLRQTQ